MNTDYQKAKITIEFEDTETATVTFAAFLRVKNREPYDPRPPFDHEDKWRGVLIPKPPQWNFTGTTIGEMTITLQR